MTIDPILLTIAISLTAITSLVAGVGIKTYLNIKKLNSIETGKRVKIAKLENESREIIRGAKHEGKQLRNRAEKQTRDRRTELKRSENRATKKQDQITKRMESIEKRERKLAKLEERIQNKESELDELKQEEFVALEKVAQLTLGEAQERLMNELEKEIENFNDLQHLLEKIRSVLSSHEQISLLKAYYSVSDQIFEWNNLMPPLKAIDNPENNKQVIALLDLVGQIDTLVPSSS